MTEASYVANNTLVKKQVGEKTGIIEGKAQISKSLSPAPTSSSKDQTSFVVSSGAKLAAVRSMGEEGGEENETVFKSTRALLPAPRSIKDAPESFTVREERSSNPDPDKTTTSAGVVVPSVIRISPASSAGKISTEALVRTSPSVAVVRPRASKTPPQEPAANRQNDKSRLSEETGKVEGKGRGNEEKSSPVETRRSNGGKKAIKRNEVKRRDEAQINFPSRSSKRMPPTSGQIPGMPPQVDGQAPTQHVQYSNNMGTGVRQHHPNRQDPHGYRQHGRGTHSASVTSSVGTPTYTGRRAHHPRGMSAGSNPGDTESETSPTIPPTPLFQRLVTEEVQELKAYTRIIEEQNRRLSELEHRTADLEKRLQKKNKENSDLERTLEFRETEWRNKFERLEADRDHQKDLVEQEKRMNAKLNYQVVQMEQEIHKFLTRKVCGPCTP